MNYEVSIDYIKNTQNMIFRAFFIHDTYGFILLYYTFFVIFVKF